MNRWFAAAAVASVATALIHVLPGGRFIARPLLTSEMRTVAKYTNYYCWHIVSIVILAMALAFVWAAQRPASTELAAAATLLAAAFSLWSVVLISWKRLPIQFMPQWWLFLIVAGLGAGGLR